MSNHFGNLPKLDAGDLQAFLGYVFAARKVPMIYGAPGIGKSSILAQWAASNGYALLDIRLAQMLPEHIASIQYVSEDRKSAVALTPAIVGQVAALEKASGKPVLILFDELTLASQETLSAALEIILDRRVSGFRLPDTCLIAAAGNRPQDTSSAMVLDPPVRSRLMSVVYQPTPADTADYIRATMPDSPLAALVADFVQSTQGRPLLTSDRPTEDAAIVTPRGIVAALEVAAHHTGATNNLQHDFVARMAFESSVGRAFFQSLVAFSVVQSSMTDPTLIIAKPATAPVPEVLEAATAQCTAIVRHVAKMRDAERKHEATQQALIYLERVQAEHLRIWAGALSAEHSALLTATARGKRLFADAGISLAADAAAVAAKARAR